MYRVATILLILSLLVPACISCSENSSSQTGKFAVYDTIENNKKEEITKKDTTGISPDDKSVYIPDSMINKLFRNVLVRQGSFKQQQLKFERVRNAYKEEDTVKKYSLKKVSILSG